MEHKTAFMDKQAPNSVKGKSLVKVKTLYEILDSISLEYSIQTHHKSDSGVFERLHKLT